jgi:flagellar hook assembly protein FlgD
VLRQNAPNPFSSRTHISWFQPAEALVRITIHDVSGSKVATLVDASYARGDHAIEWGGRDDRGRELPAGVLIGRLEIGGHVRVVKLLLSR